MSFYIILTTIIFILAVLIRGPLTVELKRKSNSTFLHLDDFFLKICFAILFILSAFRGITVGRDTKLYSRIFQILGNRGFSEQVSHNLSGYKGYRFLCRAVYVVFGNNFIVFNVIISAVTLGLLFKMIKIYSEDYYLSVILLILMYTVYNSWNLSRQYCAIAIGTYAMELLLENKTIVSFFVFLLAISFHSTAAILIIIYFVKQIRWTKRRFIFFSMLILMSTAFFTLLVRLFLYIFPRFSYLYAKQFNAGDFGSHFGGVASGRKSIVSILFLMIVIVTLAFVRSERLTKLWFFMAITMVSIIIGIVFRHYSAILRVQEYFNVICIISIPNMIEALFEDRTKRMFSKLMLVLIMLVPYIVQLKENYSAIIPYTLY